VIEEVLPNAEQAAGADLSSDNVDLANLARVQQA
jgi:hypothetical protein